MKIILALLFLAFAVYFMGGAQSDYRIDRFWARRIRDESVKECVSHHGIPIWQGDGTLDCIAEPRR